jgi:hypothetical protein
MSRDLNLELELMSKRLREAESAERELQALEAHGVDNWEHYGDAMRCFHGEGCDLCE